MTHNPRRPKLWTATARITWRQAYQRRSVLLCPSRCAQVPFVLAYHRRLVLCAALLPPGQALQWLQQRDEEERQQWVDKHRRTSLPLGKIIQDIFERREHMWEITARAPHPGAPAAPAAGQPSAGAAPRRAILPPPRAPAGRMSRGAAAPPGKSGGGGAADPSLATHLKNGKELCRSFNEGRCSEPCLRNLEHACSMIVNKSGRVCGMRNHCAVTCRKAYMR